MKVAMCINKLTMTMKICHSNIETNTGSRMELFTKANGGEKLGMATEFKYGQTEQGTKVNGVTTKLMAKGNSGMSMVTYSMASGWMTRLMDTESTLMSMALSMKVIGKTIYSMAMV